MLCWFGFFKQFPVLSWLFIRVKLACQPLSVWHGTPQFDSSELLFKSLSLAMIHDTVIFRLSKIWCRTLFLASQTHYMYTLIQLTESGEVRNGDEERTGFVKLFRSEGGEGLAVVFFVSIFKISIYKN